MLNCPRLLRLRERYILFIVIRRSKRSLSSLRLARCSRVLSPASGGPLLYISPANFCSMSDRERSRDRFSLDYLEPLPTIRVVYIYTRSSIECKGTSSNTGFLSLGRSRTPSYRDIVRKRLRPTRHDLQTRNRDIRPIYGERISRERPPLRSQLETASCRETPRNRDFALSRCRESRASQSLVIYLATSFVPRVESIARRCVIPSARHRSPERGRFFSNEHRCRVEQRRG